MKSIITFIILILPIYYLQAQTWSLVPEQCELSWTGYGEIGNFEQSGFIDASHGQLLTSDTTILSGEIIFDMTSIQHPDKSLENHLLAKDFFHTKKFPSATFEIIEIVNHQVKGLMTIRGKSNEETFDIRQTTIDDLLVISGTLSIDRTTYDIKYNSSSYFQNLGNYAIKNKFDLSFKLIFSKE